MEEMKKEEILVVIGKVTPIFRIQSFLRWVKRVFNLSHVSRLGYHKLCH